MESPPSGSDLVTSLTRSTLRVARPTRSLDAALRFWVDGVGLTLFGRKLHSDGSGTELAFLGFSGAAWHLELVADGVSVPRPTEEDLLVLYLGYGVPADLMSRIERSAGRRVAAKNPYWDQHGTTFEDPDGYRLVLSIREWSE